MSLHKLALSATVVFLVFSFNFQLAQAAQSNIAPPAKPIEKSAPADWVEEAIAPEVPESRLSAATDGIVYKLADRQIKWLPTGYAYFYRFSYTVLDRAGLEEASKISHEFDPQDTTPAFNFIRITRDGKTVDRLPDSDITVLRQEEQLDSDILNGNVTALVVLEDVRLGDTIDYAISGVVQSQLWPGEYFDSMASGWSVPIGENRYRLIWPATKPLFTKKYLTDIEPIVTQEGEWKEYRWIISDPDPLQGDDAVPAWVYSWPAVTISSMNSWEQVQDWAAPYYDVDQSLPKDFEQQVKAIRKKFRDPKERLTEALRLVQDNIRYVGIEIGLGSHVPRQPAEVVRRGYGDCKDKSVLLVAVLKKLGIKAWPALTDIDEGPGLPNYLPSPYAFDHVIVKAEIKGDVFWLDPTLSHQGGRGDALVQPDYGYGLPIGSKNAGLEEIAQVPPSQPTLQVEESYLVPQSDTAALELAVTVTYRDREADTQRRNIASQSLKDFRQSYLNYYQSQYAGLEVATPLAISDNRDKNTIKVTSSYILSKEAGDDADIEKSMSLTAWAVRGLFQQPVKKPRRVELALPHILNRSHRIKVSLPGRRPSAPDSTHETSEFGAFKRTFVVEKDTMLIDFELTNNGRAAEPNQANQMIDFAAKVQEDTHLNFHIEKVSQSYAGIFKVDETKFQAIEEEVAATLVAYSNKEFSSALKSLNKLERNYQEKDRIRGLIVTVLGETLMELNRRNAARAAFEEAVELYDDQATTYFKLAELYRANEEPRKEVEILTKFATRMPHEVGSLQSKWLGELNRILRDAEMPDTFEPLALALARADYDSESEWGDGWIYSRAIDALVAKEEPGEVAEYLEKITDADNLLSLMIDKKYKSIWPLVEAIAGSDLRRAMDRQVEDTKQSFEEDTSNFKRLNAYLHALRQAGHMQTALDVAEPYIRDWDTIEAEAGDALWTVNVYAYLLNDIGRYDEAVDLLQRINTLPIEDFPDTISMRINQAIMLQSQARFDEALELADSINQDYASDFGDMFLDGVRSCSLFKLAQPEKAQSILDDMQQHKDKNIEAYTAAVLCTDDHDRLADLFLERLEDGNDREQTLKRFIIGKPAPHTATFNREAMTKLRGILATPKVRTVFEKYGRTIDIDGYDLHWGG